MFHHTKYTKSFLITKLTTGHWSKPKSTLDTSLRVHLFFDSELYLCRSKESNNQGIKVQVKGTFKSYSFLSQKKNKKVDKLYLNFSWTPSINVQRMPQPPISKSIWSYSVVLSFSNSRSISTKWQTNFVTYYLSPLGLLSMIHLLISL